MYFFPFILQIHLSIALPGSAATLVNRLCSRLT